MPPPSLDHNPMSDPQASAPVESTFGLTDVLALCHVPRWCIVPHSRPQSVGEHSFRVVAILIDMCQRLEVEVTSRLMYLALVHDAGECRTGDVSGLAKRTAPRLKEALLEAELAMSPWLGQDGESPNEFERALLGMADKIETYTYLHRWGVGEHARRVCSVMRDEELPRAIERLVHHFPEMPVREMIYDIIITINTDAGR